MRPASGRNLFRLPATRKPAAWRAGGYRQRRKAATAARRAGGRSGSCAGFRERTRAVTKRDAGARTSIFSGAPPLIECTPRAEIASECPAGMSCRDVLPGCLPYAAFSVAPSANRRPTESPGVRRHTGVAGSAFCRFLVGRVGRICSRLFNSLAELLCSTVEAPADPRFAPAECDTCSPSQPGILCSPSLHLYPRNVNRKE